jgi:hypothetical protein
MTDYKQLFNDTLYVAQNDDLTQRGEDLALALAQAHATMHLAEQVRLSNLIQWAAITNNTKTHAKAIQEGLNL